MRRAFTHEDLLNCYRRGIFPMADSRDDPSIYFVDPEDRGIIPLDGLHVSRSLRKVIRKAEFTVTYDAAFKQVMAECAAPAEDRSDTWINDGIKFLYAELFAVGHAHSVEIWKGERLVGGLYGVSIGGAFFGESMFSRMANTSKLALYYLVERLNACGFVLLDTQFITDHLASLGAKEIPRAEYHDLLDAALKVEAAF